ncbi:hypothetical protein MRX96_009101 [Rhipicephalus microplus]
MVYHIPLPTDVKLRMKEILDNCPGNTVGSVIIQRSPPIVRQHIADYISSRDGIDVNPAKIWITNGVFHGVSIMLDVLWRRTNGKPPGVLTCVPQYMSYFDMLRDQRILRDHNWAHDLSWMQETLDSSKKHCTPRLLLLVNPSNPPGAVLSAKELEEIILFAYENELIILADEIFEHNVYNNKRPFYSVRKTIHAMGGPFTRVPVVTFSSISKGFAAEGGLQAGYMEAINLDQVDRGNLEHLMEEILPPMLPQVALDCFVKPPRPGEPSYELYAKEKAFILKSLAERAELTVEKLNAIEGIHCSPVEGSMAAYARVHIPEKAIEEAQNQGKEPDVFYAVELLKSKGVSVTPGSAFGRLPGRFYFRVTILQPRDKLEELLHRLKLFHKDFLAKYA